VAGVHARAGLPLGQLDRLVCLLLLLRRGPQAPVAPRGGAPGPRWRGLLPGGQGGGGPVQHRAVWRRLRGRRVGRVDGEWTDCSASCTGGFRSRQREVKVQPSECGKPVTGLREDRVRPVREPAPVCQRDRLPALRVELVVRVQPRLRRGPRARAAHRRLRGGRGRQVRGRAPRDRAVQPEGRAVSPEDNLPVDCVVGDWGKWSKCSVSCGGGQRTRKRHVATPAARGGAPCEGNFFVVEPCNDHSCSGDCHDCRWSDWSEWGNCTVSGQKFRTRGVDKLPNHCGKPCEDRGLCQGGGQLHRRGGRRAFLRVVRVVRDDPLRRQLRPRLCHAHALADGVKEAAEGRPRHGGAGGRRLLRDADERQRVPVHQELHRGECSPRDCRFADWSDWHQPSCSGLCERHRVSPDALRAPVRGRVDGAATHFTA
ncbi:unnamed protein product, partial [Prorocentrum cordatum]